MNIQRQDILQLLIIHIFYLIQVHSMGNTFFSNEFLRTKSQLFQNHLVRISDYLLPGEGVYWKQTEDGIVFLDSPEEEASRPGVGIKIWIQIYHYQSICNIEIKYVSSTNGTHFGILLSLVKPRRIEV